MSSSHFNPVSDLAKLLTSYLCFDETLIWTVITVRFTSNLDDTRECNFSWISLTCFQVGNKGRQKVAKTAVKISILTRVVKLKRLSKRTFKIVFFRTRDSLVLWC